MSTSTEIEPAVCADSEPQLEGPVVVFKWKAAEGWPVEYVSPNVEQVFGYPAERFLSGELLYNDIIHIDDRERVTAECEAYLQRGSAYSVHSNYRVVRADGSVIYVDEANRVVRGPDGRPKHFVGHVVDVTERRETETQLRRGKATLAEALDIAQLGYWEWDLRTGETTWSDEMYRILGVDPDKMEPSLEAYREYIHPEDVDTVFDISRKVLTQTGSYKHRFRIRRADTGELRHVRGRGRVTELSCDGRVARMVGTVQDVTETVRSEQLLRDERSWLKSLIEAMPDGISFRDGEGRWLLANDRTLEFMGLDGFDYQGKTTCELAEFSNSYGDVQLECDRTDELAWEQGEPYSFEQEVPALDGEMHTFDVIKVPVFEDDGSRKGLLVVARDISERKRTEEALKESKERLAEAQRIAHLGSWHLDLDTRQVAWSDEVDRIFGRDTEQAGEPLTLDFVLDHVLEEERERIERVTDRAANTLEPFQMEHHIVRVDGETRIVHSEGKVECDASGEAVAMVGIIQDITERKKVEQLKEEFVSIVSHELRTPLTPITGVLTLLAGGGGGELSPRAQKMVDLALRNSHRLLYLIDDLLDIQKMSSGEMDFHIRELELAKVVRESLRINISLEHQNKVKFAFTNDAPEATVRGDKGRLIQVLTNLLSNAAKFSPHNGVVDIRLSTTAEGKARISVSDQGPGIPEEFRHRVFDKFAQADSSSTRKHGGTGLGLTISKSIVERLDGEIGFETELGEGTTFFFELPLAKP
ncbi:PAS domain-containing sensor histidine kinase [Persicimonas caeni]|uniref:PAS domain-containing sensor histidine kinase n=1 Tax=Persicimonas caeni TaxID=2292766 RepID=UPI00143DAD75|nr:PAS domain-containing protein [Persicimonas caeni]